MRGVVLSGGAGSRLRPITYSMAKQLVPVANKPILFYGLEDLVETGIDQVAIIISPTTGDDVRSAVGDGSQFGLSHVEYIVQDEPLGLAHALGCALPWVDGDNVLMYLGDNLVKDGVTGIVRDFEANGSNAQILLTRVADPSAFGVVELDDEGHVMRLVEKPYRPKSDLALVGVYLFDESIAEAVASISPSARGELEITDAIQYMVDTGKTVKSTEVTGWWKDTGKREDLLHANELVLEGHDAHVAGELIGTETRGIVSVAPGGQLVDCMVTGPVIVGTGAHLIRTTLGPNTAIGARTRISDASVENSIVMDDTEIHGMKLRDSVVGRHSLLRTNPGRDWAEVTLGERSVVIEE